MVEQRLSGEILGDQVRRFIFMREIVPAAVEINQPVLVVDRIIHGDPGHVLRRCGNR